MTKIKICGITNSADALMAVQAGADALGFIFYTPAARFIAPREAANIVLQLPMFTPAVGVFVNEDAENINEIARQTGITHIQLSGDESPEIVARLNRPAIKAFRVGADFNSSVLKDWSNTGAKILLDAHVPGTYGGSGKQADWERCSGIAEKYPVILAGGLNPENIARAIQKVNPGAVDVSSGVEVSTGMKDKQKVEAFIQHVKNFGVKQG